jgi:hypothetical protein
MQPQDPRSCVAARSCKRRLATLDLQRHHAFAARHGWGVRAVKKVLKEAIDLFPPRRHRVPDLFAPDVPTR